MKPALAAACLSASLAALIVLPSASAHAQGVVRGAQEGAAAGNRAAGPVGGAIGAVGGAVGGGIVGGVKGVLGLPQNTSTRTSTTGSTNRRTSTLTRTTLRSDLLGRPLAWSNADNTQTGTTVFYTDGTAALSNSNIPDTAQDEGRWTMRGNRICVTWNKLRAGEESCSTFTRTGPKAFRDDTGVLITTR